MNTDPQHWLRIRTKCQGSPTLKKSVNLRKDGCLVDCLCSGHLILKIRKLLLLGNTGTYAQVTEKALFSIKFQEANSRPNFDACIRWSCPITSLLVKTILIICDIRIKILIIIILEGWTASRIDCITHTRLCIWLN
jgi:hypothetical protein